MIVIYYINHFVLTYSILSVFKCKIMNSIKDQKRKKIYKAKTQNKNNNIVNNTVRNHNLIPNKPTDGNL